MPPIPHVEVVDIGALDADTRIHHLGEHQQHDRQSKTEGDLRFRRPPNDH